MPRGLIKEKITQTLIFLRELRDVERMNGSHPQLLVVAGPIIERRQSKVIEDQVSIKRVRV